MPMHNSMVTEKGFLHSTAALLTGIGTLLAALVALGVFLLGEGVLFNRDPGGPDDPARPAGAVELEKKYGRAGTEGLELDGGKGIVRNPPGDADIVFYDASDKLGSYAGSIVAWKGEKQPSQQDCADLLDTHGATGTFTIEIGARFCVRSSGGRIAFLAVISDGEEYQVSLWKKS